MAIARGTTAPIQPYEMRRTRMTRDCTLVERTWESPGNRCRCVTTTPRVETQSGPFMRSSLPVAGFAVIEAATMADAVEIVSQTPCAVAHGAVEVWPLEQTP